MDSQSELLKNISALKVEKRAVILAHYYQEPQIQDIADYIGDSLGLSQQAAKTDADMIVFAGVVFMAETAKLLNPTKLVVVPDINAGCSLADNCPADKFAEFVAAHPNHTVVTYVNCSAEVKALSDILCTSANAEKIINSIPKEQPILFAPDRHLGAYLIKKTGREMVLWPGSCIVHETFDLKALIKLKARYPEAQVIAHPECPAPLLDVADFIGSTTALLNYVKETNFAEYIVATEEGILHQMQKARPEKRYYPVPAQNGCACNQCPFMRLNSLEKLYQALLTGKPEVTVDPKIQARAALPIQRMLDISK